MYCKDDLIFMSETFIFFFFQEKKTANRTVLTSEKFTGKKTRDISRFFNEISQIL